MAGLAGPSDKKHKKKEEEKKKEKNNNKEERGKIDLKKETRKNQRKKHERKKKREFLPGCVSDQLDLWHAIHGKGWNVKIKANKTNHWIFV